MQLPQLHNNVHNKNAAKKQIKCLTHNEYIFFHLKRNPPIHTLYILTAVKMSCVIF